ncbi:hypothetical protein BGZ76_000263 [Entomortierella beljakovae]|nr:hypothetical protein BGZ76_000263 [Entomortierella beljakovae]
MTIPEEKAKSTPAMTYEDIYNFYKEQIVDNHEINILSTSSRQVVGGGRDLTSRLQKRQGDTDENYSRTDRPTRASTPKYLKKG